MENMNYYEILEIKENASEEVIKAAYKALAKKYHPDSFQGSSLEREKSMAQINEAYRVLSDETERRLYDQKMKLQNDNAKVQRKESNEYYTTENYEDNECEEADFTYTQTGQWNDNERARPSNSPESTQNEKNEGGSWFGRLVKGVGREIVHTIQNNNREIENAYLDGIRMDDYLLVRRFKQARGYKRVGYSKALEEKGLLERDNEGNLVPTYRFKQLF